jgi:hypothetical protein
LRRQDDYFTAQVIEDAELALSSGERVSIACKGNPDISGYVTSATQKSFTIMNDRATHRVRVADVLLFDFPDL